MRRTYLPMLKDVRKTTASLIGAAFEEVVFVPNATHAINTITGSIAWADGDVIVICQLVPSHPLSRAEIQARLNHLRRNSPNREMHMRSPFRCLHGGGQHQLSLPEISRRREDRGGA